VEYARKWALSRNPAYFDFTGIGGDCTNFASQCLYAGSGVMNYTPITGWYYIDSGRRSASWTAVEYFYRFLTGNLSAGPYARECEEKEILPGDFVQLCNKDRCYHTLTVIDISRGIEVAAHSFDSLGRALSDYAFEYARYLHIENVRKYV